MAVGGTGQKSTDQQPESQHSNETRDSGDRGQWDRGGSSQREDSGDDEQTKLIADYKSGD